MCKVHKFRIPLYDVGVTLIVYTDSEELRTKFPKLNFDKYTVDDYDGFVMEFDGGIYIVFKKFIKDGVPYPTPGIIAHESKHLTNMIFLDIGQELDIHNDEAECYLLQWIVDHVHEFISNNFKSKDSILH